MIDTQTSSLEKPNPACSAGFNVIDAVIFILVICFQATDVAVGPIKVWECVAIVALFFLRRVDYQILRVGVFFIASLLMLSLFVTYVSQDNFSQNYGFLKSKYIISIVRGAELFLCLVVVFMVMRCLKICGVEYFSRAFLFYNAGFVLVILLAYLMEQIILGEGVVSYGGGRLRGLYVEGGPYGLYLAFLASIAIRWRRFLCFAIFAIALIFTQSKAGILMLVVAVSYYYLQDVKQFWPYLNPLRKRFLLGLMVSSVVVSGLVVVVGYNYVSDARQIKAEIAERPGDTSLVMGRIAGVFIGSKIVMEKPILGVGLGNYSLVRNDAKYRGIFPVVEGWDLTGLGGVATLLMENGVVGVLLFLILWWKLFHSHANPKSEYNAFYSLIFILPLFLGVQLYFVYPWLIIALAISEGEEARIAAGLRRFGYDGDWER